MAEEKSDKPYLEENAFEALERDFQEVINLLKEDKSLEKFQIEYEKLFAVLKNSHENEKRLMEKCRELNAELVVNSSKVAAFPKLAKEDHKIISSVKTGELAETKEKLKTATHQVEQLKKDIAVKAAALEKAHRQTEKEKDLLKAELHKMKKQALETKCFIEHQESEKTRLLKVIAEADAERLKQKKEFEQVIKERDCLGSMLVQRNDEVAQLYEKIKILQSILNRGETQFQQRVEDIRLLKLEIKKLHREERILGKSAANTEELRQEAYRMQKELLREQARCKVLEKELENPLNVHRWRKLEASDPSTYELIQKIQRLQKRLIRTTDEVTEKELLLQEKEKLCTELKRALARQPGPEATKQLQHYQHALREKTKQLKVLASELNMYKSQCQEYKYENERLGKELLDVKKKYLAQKDKEQQAKEKERLTDLEPEFPRRESDVPCVTRSGFALSRPLPKITS